MALTQDPCFHLFGLVVSISVQPDKDSAAGLVLTQQGRPLIFCQSGSRDNTQPEDGVEGESPPPPQATQATQAAESTWIHLQTHDAAINKEKRALSDPSKPVIQEVHVRIV